MGIVDAGAGWLKLVLAVPVVALFVAVVAETAHTLSRATQASSAVSFGPSPESAAHNRMPATELLDLALSIETWMLLGLVVLAVYSVLVSRSGRVGR